MSNNVKHYYHLPDSVCLEINRYLQDMICNEISGVYYDEPLQKNELSNDIVEHKFKTKRVKNALCLYLTIFEIVFGLIFFYFKF